MKKNVLLKRNIFIIIGTVLFATSLILFYLHSTGVRYILFFESLDTSGLFTEIRYLPRHIPCNSTDSKEQCKNNRLEYFVNEVLLGPTIDRYKLLFPYGTHTLFCILSDSVLYVNLSKEALPASAKSSQTEVACQLLEKNIVYNYNGIDKVIIFMGGYEVYNNNGKKSSFL